MGCDDPAACHHPGRKVEDWAIPDPGSKSIEEVRLIRDSLQVRVEALARRLELEAAAAPEGLRRAEGGP